MENIRKENSPPAKKRKENPNATSGPENQNIWNENFTRLDNSRLRHYGRKEKYSALNAFIGIIQTQAQRGKKV